MCVSSSCLLKEDCAGTQAVEIVLQAIDMAVAQIITHKMVMERKEGMSDTVVHEAALIGMEVE